MRLIRSFVLVSMFVLLGTPVLAAERDIVVYTQIDGKQAEYGYDFKAVIRKAINALARFDLVDVRRTPLSDRHKLDARMKASAKANIPWLVQAVLTTKKNDGNLVVEIYSTKSGDLLYRWKDEDSVKNMKAYLANLEYKLPNILKAQFLELGHVIRKDKRIVYFDLGETAGIKAGEIFQIYEEGDEIEDEDGNSFGRLESTTGIVKVVEVTSVYSVAEIIIGSLSIEPEQMVRKIRGGKESDFRGEILAVLEDQVAINIGKNVGVREGSFYAVYRDIKQISKGEAFRLPVGHIKINEVFDDFSKGELSISNNFELTKHIIASGDRVEEVESPRKNMWSINQMMTNVNGEAGEKVLYMGYQRDSAVNSSMIYRLKLGYNNSATTTATTKYFGALGVMHAIDHSSHFFFGMDFLYVGDIAMNMFVSADVDTPVSKNLKLSMETGYVVDAGSINYNGINTSIGLKYAFDLF